MNPTGPRTPEGKARTRLNAVRHGLTSREFVFSPEDAALYTQHAADLHSHYLPQGPIETQLVNSIASSLWRLDRAAAIEEGIFAIALHPESSEDDALAPARAWLADSRSLGLLTTYESRIRRALAADKAELAKLQQSRTESVCSTPVAPPEFVCSAPPPPPETARPALPTAAGNVVFLVQTSLNPPRRDAA